MCVGVCACTYMHTHHRVCVRKGDRGHEKEKATLIQKVKEANKAQKALFRMFTYCRKDVVF